MKKRMKKLTCFNLSHLTRHLLINLVVYVYYKDLRFLKRLTKIFWCSTVLKRKKYFNHASCFIRKEDVKQITAFNPNNNLKEIPEILKDVSRIFLFV